LRTHVLVRPIGLLFLLASLAVCGASASLASAAVPGLEVVKTPSVDNSADSKSATARCPFGKRVIGTGVDIDNGVGDVIIDDVIPRSTSVKVTAYEDDNGAPTIWRINAYAICAYPLPGLEIVKKPSSDSSSGPKSIAAKCPAGEQVVGTGADIDNGVGDVLIDDLIPRSTSVTVTAYEDDNGAPTIWRINAYAICAYPPPGLRVVQLPKNAPAVVTSADPKSMSATCPFPKRLTGLGGQITGGLGQVAIDDLIPNTTTNRATVKGYEDDNGTTSNWWLRAYAICASP
jgi:hypothetical protein